MFGLGVVIGAGLEFEAAFDGLGKDSGRTTPSWAKYGSRIPL